MKEPKIISLTITPDEYGYFQLVKIEKSKYTDVPSVKFCSGITIDRIIETLTLMQTDNNYDDTL